MSSYLTAPPALQAFLLPYCTMIGLPLFAEVAHISIVTCALSFLLQKISSIMCPILFPATYPKLQAKKDDWDLHVVGWAYSIIATPLALSLILNPSQGIIDDPIFGYALPEARLTALAVGYFFWDAQATAKHISTQGLGFFLHGSGCFSAYLLTLSPFLLFCGPNFLIWEVSTIFLNIHWYLDKFGLTGSTYQLINGVILVTAYVSARLIWGTYQSFHVISLLFFSPQSANLGPLKYIYGGLNIGLNGLNFFWFRSMVLALQKRFDPTTSKEAIQVDGKLSWKKNKKAE